MVDAPAPGTPTLTGSLPFYNRPEPLTPEAHGQLGLRRTDAPLSFAKEAHVLPITVGEFGPCALSYPIIFTGGERLPLAVMGLRQGDNLFITADGKLDGENYLPAYVRRYPFVFAEDKGSDRLVVCIDAGSDLIGADGETKLFEDGKPSAFTNDAIEFLKGFETQRQTTIQLGKILEELDLFEKRDIEVRPRQPDGTISDPVKIAEFQAVSTEKLNALPTDKFMSLRDNGALAAIYTHLNSLLNWDRLIAKAGRKASAAG